MNVRLAHPEPSVQESTARTGEGAHAGSQRAWRRAIPLACCVAFGLLATGIVLYGLAAPTGLYGITQYDDGVYLGAALRLVSGAIPYRDFVFVQPPGIAVLMTPVAALAHVLGTSGAMAVARVLTALVVGLNAFMVGLLVRHLGVAAVVVAAGLLAIYPPAFYADHTLLLEPWAIAFCLFGANLVFKAGEVASEQRVLLGGVALGLGATIKLWSLVPIAILFLCLLGRGWRIPRAYAVGVVAGFVVVSLPFFVLAPSAFFHDVVITQLARQTTSPRQPLVRLWGIVGLNGLSLTFTRKLHQGWAVALAAVIGAVLLLGGAIPALRRRCTRLELFALASALASVALLFVPAEYFNHYTYFSAAFVALALGCASGRSFAAVSTLTRRPHGSLIRVPIGVIFLGAAIVGGAWVVTSETRFDRSALRQDPNLGAAIAAVVPAGACVTSDQVTLTIEANRFWSKRAGCPNVVDSEGTWLAEDPSEPTGIEGPGDASLVTTWQGLLARSEYVVLRAPDSFRIPWTPSLRATFAADFARVGGGDIAVYARRPARS